MNHRVKKESYVGGDLKQTTFYVRDVAGQVMAVYSDGGGEMALAEQPIYGMARLGVAYNGMNDVKTYVYELTDHLGNVRAVFTKNGADNHQVEGYTDYYPGGMPMPNRTLNGAEGYRYAFQGQEKDPETGKEAFELRLWDSRIGRWLTTDPYGQFNSPYLGMGNNPIGLIDRDGGFADCPECDQNAPLGSTQTDSAGFDWTMQDDGWARSDGFEVTVYGISKETQNYWAGVNALAENLNKQQDLETGKSASIRMLEELEKEAETPIFRQVEPTMYDSSGALEYVSTGGIALLKLLKNPNALKHIFRNAPGHVNPTTVASQNRYLKLFSSVVSDTKNLVQTTNAAKINANVKTFHRTYRSGKQVWVETINGKIVNAGINNTPR